MKMLLKSCAAVGAVLAAAPRVLAQGCAMCYADAAAQSPRARHQLDLAILTLLIPSLSLFAGVLIAAFRRREHGERGDEQLKGFAAPAPRLSIPARRSLAPGTAPDRV